MSIWDDITSILAVSMEILDISVWTLLCGKACGSNHTEWKSERPLLTRNGGMGRGATKPSYASKQNQPVTS
jgi:hypothetical protein